MDCGAVVSWVVRFLRLLPTRGGKVLAKPIVLWEVIFTTGDGDAKK